LPKTAKRVLTNFKTCCIVIASKGQPVNDEIRKSLTVKIKPSMVKKARLRAVTCDKTLGEWLEEAIEEKAAKEEREEKQ